MIALIVLGALQSILTVFFPQNDVVTLLDDVALALSALALCLGRFKRVPITAWSAGAAWCVLLLIAIIRSSAPLLPSAQAARQIAIPAVLILIGIGLTRKEWILVAKVALMIGVANGVYAVVEMVFGRIIDPGAMARPNDRKPHGVPASYFWYDANGVEHGRAGGLVLNAPVAGIVIAGAIVVGWYLSRRWWHYALVVLLVVPLYLTYSRSGMVLAIAGVLIPLALRYGGLIVAFLVGAAGSVAGYMYFMTHGASFRHVNGLLNAFPGLSENPFGAGFGTYGNTISRAVGGVDGGESLVGLAVAALGIPGILMIVGMLVVIASKLLTGVEGPVLLGLGLGLFVAGLFVESVSALNGTVVLWVGVGYALMHSDPANKVGVFPSLGRERGAPPVG